MNRIILSLTDDMLERITDWQHEQRLPNRAEAIRQMLETACVMRSVKRGREVMAKGRRASSSDER